MPDFDLPETQPLPKPGKDALEEEVRALRRLVAKLPEYLEQAGSCREAEKLLACIWSARTSLDRLEAEAQGRHLNCCVLADMPVAHGLSHGLARLRDQGLGATIICEHHEPLDEYAARGVPVETPFSAAALEALFDPQSRVRDGAVLLRGDEVVAAGIPLPPASRQVDEQGVALGERQRAALALSRISDALVFVVCEETGEVSVALDGHLRALAAL